VYIEQVSLSEFRAIRSSSIRFVHPASPGADRREFPNINLLVGGNGGGKSTVLKAIAAATVARHTDLMAVTDGEVLGWPRIGATQPATARVTLRVPGTPDVAADTGDQLINEGVTITRESNSPHVEPFTPSQAAPPELPMLFAYGSRRALAEPDRDLPSGGDEVADAVASLLSDQTQLTPPERLFAESTAGQRRDLLDLINPLMPPETVVTGDIDSDGRLLVESRGLVVPRTMLSDGAQSFCAWLFDLLYRLERHASAGDVRAVAGTVLVDEIDQRMHPNWQQTLLSQLSGGLPQLQFIATAHSPLVAAGLRAENLTLLEPDPDAPGHGAMQATQLDEDLYGRTADGVLTSSYFNLPSSRSDLFGEQLQKLADAGHDHDDAALEFIRTLTAGSSGTARTPLVSRPERFQRRRP
jgi:energy-coupling factor transporter ATP-binding protein EcfA2